MKNVVAVVVVVLAGCAASGPPQAYYSASPYDAGKFDGCSSGENAAGNPWKAFRKDVNRYMSDQYYKQGFDDGYQICKGQYEAIGRAMAR